jgi:nicotinate-nucleotide pyrophosphorylase (carboxylating)
VPKDFQQVTWDERTEDDCRHIIRLAVREDLDRWHDLTTMAMVPRGSRGTAHVVLREMGVLAGSPAVELVVQEMNLDATWTAFASDGTTCDRGTRVGTLAGSTRDILTAERTVLNLLGRISGIATGTRRYVAAVEGTAARIYDTRKTTPGWRRMEKYAVHCGGGRNHRIGLFDAVLIKDNHLAQAASHEGGVLSPALAVTRAREFLAQYFPEGAGQSVIIEVEVDTTAQFAEALSAQPDIILLDNMSLDELRECVARRNQMDPTVQLEASGGIKLANVRAVAETGVDRISLGALTHSAVSLDVALDWETGGGST